MGYSGGQTTGTHGTICHAYCSSKALRGQTCLLLFGGTAPPPSSLTTTNSIVKQTDVQHVRWRRLPRGKPQVQGTDSVALVRERSTPEVSANFCG
jgi:hypothetical protein